MSIANDIVPSYLFEVGWEVCNKIGGIHTVIATKALQISEVLPGRHICIGPDVYKDTTDNPEFLEDKELFRGWRERLFHEGLRIRVGRWNIPGYPIVFLVDTSSYISKKDELLKWYWEQFNLDSLTGQWDYIEPVLFGFSAGRVIESFYHYTLTGDNKVVAHFHEWMTGTGLLYLKAQMPLISTIFTTHATVLGRCLAGASMPLYESMLSVNPDLAARDHNVQAKHSLEKTAANEADVFTTVSSITAKECSHFLNKTVDLITPNGFDSSIVPGVNDLKLKRIEARIAMLEVAEALLARPVAQDCIILGTSGRYEFKNKGLDVFIDSLGLLNKDEELKKEVLAFFFVPANQHGPRKDLVKNLHDKNIADAVTLQDPFLTHYLVEPSIDPVLNKIRQAGLGNGESDKVKVFFVPSYLNGNDGIFNKKYYELLVGLDASVFASYYEPWGYTPQESLAFHVPTFTTSLAGFGNWMEVHGYTNKGLEVIPRTDSNYPDVVENIKKTILNFTTVEVKQFEKLRVEAGTLAAQTQWRSFVKYYQKAYSQAINKSFGRTNRQVGMDKSDLISFIDKAQELSKPRWSKVFVQKNVPERLKPLEEISRNYWWSWSYAAQDLYKEIDPDLWESCGKNPVDFLNQLSFLKYRALETDSDFLSRLNSVYSDFKSYIEKKEKNGYKVAYFSMEYGIDRSLKIYSGGLGVLAGDYLKEASDQNAGIVAVGLLYRYGYFAQQLSSTGQQISLHDAQDFSKLAITQVKDCDGSPLTISLPLPGRRLFARVWRADVGRTELYLLDSDYEANLPEDRTITHQLYGGDWENRLKQEVLLGIGGIRALKRMGINPNIYHCNEGHAAFIGLERMVNYIEDEKLSYAEAIEVVRSSSIFTTHTPVPAGHDAFPEEMLRPYLSYLPARLKISWEQLLRLGDLKASNPAEKFSMSMLAANLSQEINGVSMLHGEVSRDIFKKLYNGYMPSELHIGYVTNGVHYPTWASKEIVQLIENDDVPNAAEAIGTPAWKERIDSIDDRQLWETKHKLRSKLIEVVRRRLLDPTYAKYDDPKQAMRVEEGLRDDILIIGFARRFATYKRASLLFRDMERLKAIVSSTDRPILFLFAGKAHPNDKPGQDLIKYIVEMSKREEFEGKVIFLQNYDMELARSMVQGVDIWLNNPMRPMEASGTSGQKAVMNGTLHFSVLDGWWVEGYQQNAGWALPQEQLYENQEYQDQFDAETIYSIIEDDVLPSFYEKGKDGVPHIWIEYIKNSLKYVAPQFTTKRMLHDYQKKYYKVLIGRNKDIGENSYDMAREYADWKRKVLRNWSSIGLLSLSQFQADNDEIILGKKYSSYVKLDLKELSTEDVGVELVVAKMLEGDAAEILVKKEYDLVETEGPIATYKVDLIPITPGIYEVGVRVFAKCKYMPHRQDFCLVRWL
ncbi:alpha-glucan family phosphorylase [Alistipes sp. ZOR0009]|uniref:alpha-glucan family phosphorylase n=1 Tax=Alistipes sp. ZOR0009 TaxID=1339253 RepID=UPI000647CCF8|nr:alpha-glucan family phosphorylase [Alistipes sp. ZOR0009]